MRRAVVEPRVEYLPAPARESFGRHRDSATSLVTRVETIVVDSQESFEIANGLMLDVKSLYQEIHRGYRSIVDPLEESRKNAAALFDPVLKRLGEAERDVKKLMGDFLLARKAEQDRLEREAREKLEAAKRALDEQREKDARAAAEATRRKTYDDATAAGLPKEEAAELADLEANDAQARKLAEPSLVLRAKRVEKMETSFDSLGGKSNVQFEWDYEIVDLHQLYSAFGAGVFVDLQVKRAAILAELRKTNGAPLPGLRVVRRPKITGIV